MPDKDDELEKAKKSVQNLFFPGTAKGWHKDEEEYGERKSPGSRDRPSTPPSRRKVRVRASPREDA